MTLGSLFDGKYIITREGRLYSTRKGKYLRPATDKYGYLYYTISVGGERHTFKAHRLVAQAYIPNPSNKPTVDHINGIRKDNRVENLRWATLSEQQRNPVTVVKTMAIHKNTDYRAMGAKRNFGRKKTAVYDGDILLGEYNSLKEAITDYPISYGHASMCANGKSKSAGGLRYCYL